MKRFDIVLFASLLVAGGLCFPARAAVDTAQMQVRIVITESCDIHSAPPSDLDFGTHARSTGAPVDSEATLQINCTLGTPYSIGLNEGSNATGSTAAADNRRMISANGDFIPYGLYRDTARNEFWGEVAGTNTHAGVGTASSQIVTVYGRVPSTNAPTGSYADTVVATVTY